MSLTDLIIHDEKDNVAVVVIDKTSKNQECTGGHREFVMTKLYRSA